MRGTPIFLMLLIESLQVCFLKKKKKSMNTCFLTSRMYKPVKNRTYTAVKRMGPGARLAGLEPQSRPDQETQSVEKLPDLLVCQFPSEMEGP